MFARLDRTLCQRIDRSEDRLRYFMPLFAGRVFLAISSNSLDSVIKFNDKGMGNIVIRRFNAINVVPFPFIRRKVSEEERKNARNYSQNFSSGQFRV